MPGQTVDRGSRGDPQAGGRIQLEQFDAAPIGSEGEPQTAIVIPENARIDGVEIVVQGGAEDRTGVGPMKVGGGGIQRGIGGESDGGDAFAPGGRCVIEQIAVALLDDVRGPKHALVAGHGVGDPGGHLMEHPWTGQPVGKGGGMMGWDAHAGGEKPMFRAAAGNGGGVMDVHAARPERARVARGRAGGGHRGAELALNGRAASDLHGDGLRYQPGGAGAIEDPLKFTEAVGGDFRRGLLEGGAFAGGVGGLDFNGGVSAVGELKRDRLGLPGGQAGELEVGLQKTDGLARGTQTIDQQQHAE